MLGDVKYFPYINQFILLINFLYFIIKINCMHTFKNYSIIMCCMKKSKMFLNLIIYY